MAYCEKKDSKDYVFHVDTEDLKDVEDPKKAYGAFDPVRREIDWDCPCIGGALKGPCAEDFKQAFSCFVYSEEADKGSDCYNEFLNMNHCFGENAAYYEEEKRRESEERKKAGVVDDEDEDPDTPAEDHKPTQPDKEEAA